MLMEIENLSRGDFKFYIFIYLELEVPAGDSVAQSVVVFRCVSVIFQG